jgi:hypothetical protein
MSNLLIVESENDKYFIEALIKHLNIANVEVSDALICNIDDFECLGGLSSPKLATTLKAIKLRAKKDAIQKIGILIDIDNKTIIERLTLVNDALKTVFETEVELPTENRLIDYRIDEVQTVQIATYFTNANGEGELETLLKAIKSEDSTHADCLESWQNCLQEKGVRDGEGLKQKDFDKFWVQQYVRYDTCTNREQRQAGTKCNNQAAMQKPIWDFEHEYLNGLKDFLNLFID